MKLNSLTPAEGSVKNNFRRGRGQGSGGGGTATQGHKGAQSRSGNKKKRGFEGGQMPLQRRVPKFGFKNINRINHTGVNLDAIQKLVDTKNITDITRDVLLENGLASKNSLIKIMGRGELKSKVNITVHAFTATAKAAIESKGGVATEI
ncbi:MAG: 50S ribosomal protein L15 [Bacteroidota bacterium]|jgi:large subunit ribosomal protein L15|nr:50S ribosomal protein L15 [Bacteroidota bacterium]